MSSTPSEIKSTDVSMALIEPFVSQVLEISNSSPFVTKTFLQLNFRQSWYQMPLSSILAVVNLFLIL